MVFIPPQYAYLSLSMAVLVVWAVLLYLNKRGRTQQLIFSAIFAVAGPIGELLYIPDYWHPGTIWSIPILNSYVSFEDLIFGFSIMGIMSALPALLLKTKDERISAAISWGAILKIASAFVVVWVLSMLLWLGGLNSIFATSLAMLIVAAIVLLSEGRSVLLRVSGIGALSMVLVMFVIYWLAFALIADTESILRSTWTLYGTPLGTRFLRVPLAELGWAFSFGSLFSVLFIRYRA